MSSNNGDRNSDSGDERPQRRYKKKYDYDWWSYIPPKPTEEEIFWTITPGENFKGYDDLKVNIMGYNSSRYKPAKSFEETGLSRVVLNTLERAEFKHPTAVQKYAIQIISDERDLMVCAQTGCGKTAAYLLPIISNLSKMKRLPQYNEVPSPRVLVLAPTTELARQIHIDAKRFATGTNIRVVAIYGGCSIGHQVDELQSKHGCHIVVATPGRLMTLLGRPNGGKPREPEISLAHVKYLILDEADRMLVAVKKVGKRSKHVTESGFYFEVLKLVRDFDMPAKEDRQTLMFSATFPKEIQELAMTFLNPHIHLVIGEIAGCIPFEDISQRVIRVEAKDKREKLVEILTAEEGRRNLVFVTRKKQASELVEYLTYMGFIAAEIHSGLVQKEREISLKEFRGEKKGDGKIPVPIIVATAAAARGLDIEGVEQVINYDLPDVGQAGVGIEEYIHKIGRTGRIGNKGRALSFYDPQKDGRFARSLVQALADSHQDVPDWLEDAAFHAVGTVINADKNFVSRDIRR